MVTASFLCSTMSEGSTNTCQSVSIPGVAVRATFQSKVWVGGEFGLHFVEQIQKDRPTNIIQERQDCRRKVGEGKNGRGRMCKVSTWIISKIMIFESRVSHNSDFGYRI